MKRLLGCAGIALALCTVSLAAGQIDADDIVTLAPSVEGYTLACPSQTTTQLDQVVQPNATRSPFTIQPGTVFVMTGVNWAESGAQGYDLDVNIRNLATGSVEVVTMVAGENQNNGLEQYHVGALMVTPGVVVGPGTAICAGLVRGGGSSRSIGTRIRVYGYFAKTNNKPRLQASPVIGR